MGNAKNPKAYKLLDLDSNDIVESRDVEFLEIKFIKESNEVKPTQTQGIVSPNSSSSNKHYKKFKY